MQQSVLERSGIPGTGSAMGMPATADSPGETYPLNYDYETMEEIPTRHHNVVLAAIHGMSTKKIAAAYEYASDRPVKKILNHRPVAIYMEAQRELQQCHMEVMLETMDAMQFNGIQELQRRMEIKGVGSMSNNQQLSSLKFVCEHHPKGTLVKQTKSTVNMTHTIVTPELMMAMEARAKAHGIQSEVIVDGKSEPSPEPEAPAASILDDDEEDILDV